MTWRAAVARARSPGYRVLKLTLWGWIAWILLTWTRTESQMLFGLGLSFLVAVGCATLGPVGAPWKLLAPRRLLALARLAVTVSSGIVRANVSLAIRIWRPSRPLRSGMVIVPTRRRSDGALTAVGLLTSVIVDNQLVDLHRERHQLQYHAVWVAADDPAENYRAINGPVEDGMEPLAE